MSDGWRTNVVGLSNDAVVADGTKDEAEKRISNDEGYLCVNLGADEKDRMNIRLTTDIETPEEDW